MEKKWFQTATPTHVRESTLLQNPDTRGLNKAFRCGDDCPLYKKGRCLYDEKAKGNGNTCYYPDVRKDALESLSSL